MSTLLAILLFLTSVFLILLVLIQRGRGGGLAGAFGGLGGQSAFGTKAGDLFTRVTIVVATIWILLCAASVKLLNNTGEGLLSNQLGAQSTSLDEAASKAPADSKAAVPADSKAATPATDAKAPAEGATPAAEAPAAATPAAAPAAAETPAADAPAKSE